ncbi:hypothetical protein KOR34_38660 [Posidoniimonas corsicana]|uniref:Uncharacterized protein n=1 Tax=Posidoniimonas corsicana TaxID=1938618 RepID=A0A5C5V7H2_9BACT|nr:hypothetical protein [Posidoniimonas corsicana]TWT34030.1 hypothetical protein KOR34_38660 [Posidoniimonas corsicana]
MPDASPFDDDAPEAPPPAKRERRPWWRWNIITLFVVLFVLAWVRELGGLSMNATWLMVFSVFFCWWVGPVFLVERPPLGYTPPPGFRSEVTPVMSEPHNEFQAAARRPGPPPRDYGTRLMLTGLRRFALALMLVGVVCAMGVVVAIFAQLAQGGMRMYGGGFAGFWFGTLSAMSTPALITLNAGVLYTLTLIADRLGERRDEH